jgi:predicted chitinase
MPDGALVGSDSILVTLLLCGLMGLLGQGVRSAIGLKNALSGTASQQTSFNAAYFFLSLMIGFIAGVLAGLALGLTSLMKVNPGDLKILLGIAAAGYAGADFIENSLSIIIPDTGKVVPVIKTGAAPTAFESASLKIISDHTAALNRIAASEKFDDLFRIAAAPVVAVSAAVPDFAAALRGVAPSVNLHTWEAPLSAAFSQFDVTSPRRISAAIGQFLVEAREDFGEIKENLRYTHANLLVQNFSVFHNEDEARPYLNNPEKLGNKVYANRLGNGNEASGDGFRFRGRGLIQLTGRSEYSEFGATVDMTAEQAAAYCETPTGAAVSGCWYLSSRGCLPYADSWNIDKITLLVNGRAMLEHAKRLTFSRAMLRALGGS